MRGVGHQKTRRACVVCWLIILNLNTNTDNLFKMPCLSTHTCGITLSAFDMTRSLANCLPVVSFALACFCVQKSSQESATSASAFSDKNLSLHATHVFMVESAAT